MPYGTVNADVIGTSVAGSNLGAGNASIMKNRIINGAMVIDQRNAGASVSVTNSAPKYATDRFKGDNSNSGSVAYSLQQVADAPTGFTYSLKATTTSAAATGSAEYQFITQIIEGYNIADLGWGTANAQTITLSFWAKSSLTGTFAGFFGNAANTQMRSFTYTLSSANTWTFVSVTIPGSTSGTWGNTNTSGIALYFSVACGTSYQVSPGSWSGTLTLGAPGQVNLTATNGATWQVTGVQLEVGSSATGFEYRQYGNEMSLCQRYFNKWTVGGYQTLATVSAVDGTSYVCSIPTNVYLRAYPTITGTGNFFSNEQGDFSASSLGILQWFSTNIVFSFPNQGTPPTYAVIRGGRSTGGTISASAEL